MGKRDKIPSFVAEVPLRVGAVDAAVLDKRFRAAQNLFNACLGETLRRLDLMRESRDWRRARAMPRHMVDERGRTVLDDNKQPRANPVRVAAFNDLRERFGFSSGELQKWMQGCRDACWIGEHLGSHDAQRVGERAFKAVADHAYRKKGRPRFCRLDEFSSVEAKSNSSVITWRMSGDGRTGHVSYLKLRLEAILPPPGKDPWLEDALKKRTKYVRIVRRATATPGRYRYAAQLVQEGVSPLKAWHRAALAVRPDAPVGVDQGPSNVAVVAEHGAELMPLAPNVIHPWKETRRLDRAMDRSRRACNPENYEADGTVRKGRKQWKRSTRYRELQSRRAGKERRLAAERKRSHGAQTSRVMLSGSSVKLEKVSYLSLQKNYGRSTKVRGVGLWVGCAKSKAVRFACPIVELPLALRLSQFDHTTGDFLKKALSERCHVFRDGITAPVQRDLYSGFLARHARQDDAGTNALDAAGVEGSWQAAEPLLRMASGELEHASGTGLAGPHVVAPVRRRRSVSSARGGHQVRYAVHGVAVAEAGTPPTAVREGQGKRHRQGTAMPRQGPPEPPLLPGRGRFSAERPPLPLAIPSGSAEATCQTRSRPRWTRRTRPRRASPRSPPA